MLPRPRGGTKGGGYLPHRFLRHLGPLVSSAFRRCSIHTGSGILAYMDGGSKQKDPGQGLFATGVKSYVTRRRPQPEGRGVMGTRPAPPGGPLLSGLRPLHGTGVISCLLWQAFGMRERKRMEDGGQKTADGTVLGPARTVLCRPPFGSPHLLFGSSGSSVLPDLRSS